MLGQLSCRELARALVPGSLGEALARLGAGVDARSEAQAEAVSASTELVLNR